MGGERDYMVRTQIFGDPADMGDDAEVSKELKDMDAAEAEAAAEEKEQAEQEALNKQMARRGTKGLKKFV